MQFFVVEGFSFLHPRWGLQTAFWWQPPLMLVGRHTTLQSSLAVELTISTVVRPDSISTRYAELHCFESQMFGAL